MSSIPTDRPAPYRSKMHYDATRQGVWIGFGVDLDPACGQREWIGVTGSVEIVDCQRCLRSLASDDANN